MSTEIIAFKIIFINDNTAVRYGIKVEEQPGCVETFCENLKGVAEIIIITMARIFKRKDSQLMISYKPPYSIEGTSPLSLRRYFTLSEDEQSELWHHIRIAYHQEYV